MDVSAPPPKPSNLPLEQAICCDVCGYPRIGLPETAKCPECGEDPPALVKSRFGHPTLTVGRRRWLRQIALGLILLVFSYISALQIILVMNLDAQVLAAVNMPAPKIAATALIQRAVGNRPGPWGVSGTLAVMGSVLAVW